MADDSEVFEIQVTDTGTQQVIAQLQQLGLTGEQAAARVESGYTRISTSATGATSNTVLMNRAAKDGSVDMGALSDALDLLTNAELRAAERAGTFSAAQDTVSASTANATRAVNAHTGSIGGLGGSIKNITGLLAGFAGYLGLKEFIEASDNATKMRNAIIATTDSVSDLGTKIGTGGAEIVNLGKESLIAAQHLVNLSDSFKLPTAADDLKNAQTALAQFNAGLTDNKSAIDHVNQSMQEFDQGMIKLGSSSVTAANASGNVYHAYQIEGVVTDDLNSKARERAALINNVRLAMVAATEEQDRATASGRSFNSMTDAQKEVYTTLRDAAEANGVSFEKEVELYKRLSEGAKAAGLSLSDTEQVTVLVTEQMRRFQVSGRPATATINELAEGFSEGTIKGKQLQAILREFPQLLQPVADKLTAGNVQTLVAQYEKTGISIQQFASGYLASSDQIARASQKVTLTISGALTSLKTKFDDYISNSQEAAKGGDLLVFAIGKLGDALPTLIPLIAGLALGFGALKFGEYAIDAGKLLFALNPLTFAIGATAGALAYLVNGYANYLVSTGNAKDKSDALYQTLQLFKPLFDEIKQVVTDATTGFTNFIASFGTGATDADKFRTGLTAIATQIASLIQALDALGTSAATIFGNMIKLAYNVGVVIGNIINRLRAVGTNQDFGSITDGTTSLTPFRNGGVIYARDGVEHHTDVGKHFKVPGADRPDTVPLAMMVTKGERVIVQTEDQQAKHDKIMRTFRDGGIAIPHFATGGYVLTSPATAASTTSVTGYSAGSYGPANVVAPTSTPAAAVSTTDSGAAVAQKTAASQNNGWAYRNPYGTLPYAQDQTALKAKLFPYPGLDTVGGNWPGVQHHAYTDGTNPEVLAFDGSKPTTQNANVGPAGENIEYSFYQGIPQIPLPQVSEDWFMKLNYGLPPKNIATANHDANHGTGLGFRDGGMIYARDGVDFTVPGAGPVDSRTVNMAVSPGERVRVDTADEAARDGRGAGTVRRTPAMPITIVASDPGAFGRSKRQITDAIAKGIRRTP